MSAISLLAACILSCDFLLFFLYQWTYGEKRRKLTRSRAPNGPLLEANPRPFLVTPPEQSTVSKSRGVPRKLRSSAAQNSVFQPHHSIRESPAR